MSTLHEQYGAVLAAPRPDRGQGLQFGDQAQVTVAACAGHPLELGGEVPVRHAQA